MPIFRIAERSQIFVGQKASQKPPLNKKPFLSSDVLTERNSPRSEGRGHCFSDGEG